MQQSVGQKFTKSVLKIHVREICDSHGIPTVEVGLHTSKGLFRPAVPSSASIGVYEVQDKTYYVGKAASKAVEHMNKAMAPFMVSKKLTVVE